MILLIKRTMSEKKGQIFAGLFLFTFFLAAGCGSFGRKGDALAEDKIPEDDALMTNAAIQDEIRNLSVLPDSVKNTIDEKDYPFVISELSYEIKRMGAELKHLSSEVQEMKKKAELLENPLKIYNKEIILNNGTSVYGKITFQDSRILKVETLIGYLIIERKDIVRIVENFPDVPETATQQAAQPAGTVESRVATATAFDENALPLPSGQEDSYEANCILVDNVRETTDNSGNRIFSGTVKNIGTRRADFVKINVVFRTNWSGGTKTLTAFVKGSYHTYSSGISSDNALLPGASGSFSLLVPSSFGTFIGYTYNLDWEAYD